MKARYMAQEASRKVIMIAILFSGQGSQEEGLGLDLYNEYEEVRDLYDNLPFSFDLKKISFEGSMEEMSKTQYTQPVLVTFHLAVLRLLKKFNVHYDIAAGLSLGEYSALAAAGVLTEEDALSLIEKRAEFMADSCHNKPSTLIALLGQEVDDVTSLIDQWAQRGIIAQIANHNAPGQVVIGLKKDDQEAIEASLENAEIKFRNLDVEGAFHTGLMKDAAERLAPYLDQVDFRSPSAKLYLNLTGQEWDGSGFRPMLVQQMTSTTQFASIFEGLQKDGVTKVIEVGKRNIFKGMLKRIDKSIEVIPVHSVESLEKAVEKLKESGE